MEYTIKQDRLVIDGAEVNFVPSPNHGGRITPTLVVVHDTAGRLTKGSSVSWFKKRRARSSAHFVVEMDGTVTQMVDCDVKAWHAGKSNYNGRKNCNAFSIGIEIVNPGKLIRNGGANPVAWFGQEFPEGEFDIADMVTKEHGRGAWMAYSPEQLAAVEGILKALKQAYPIKDVVAHYEISPRRKIDVNPLFPLEKLRDKALGKKAPNKFLLQIGDEGDKVFQVQQRLVKLGYGAVVKKPDGFFGPNTKRGVLLWEDENGIARDGKLSDEEIKLLIDAPSKSMATGEATDQKKEQTKKEALGTAVVVPAGVAAANYFGVDPNSLWEGLLSALTKAGEVVGKVSGAGLPVTPEIAKWAIAGALGLILMRWFSRLRA